MKPNMGCLLALGCCWTPCKGDTRICLLVAATAVWWEPEKVPAVFVANMVISEPSPFHHRPCRSHWGPGVVWVAWAVLSRSSPSPPHPAPASLSSGMCVL